MILNQKVYDILKSIAQIWLPALGTLIFAISDTWQLSHAVAAQIVGSMMALDAFLGMILGISSKSYVKAGKDFDGELVIDETDPGKILHSFEPITPIDKLSEKSEFRMKVTKVTGQPPS